MEDGFLRESLDDHRLVALGVDELVVHDLDAGIIGGEEADLIRNGLRVGKGRSVLAHTSEAHDNALLVGSGELSLGLLTKDNDVGIGLILDHATGGLAETGMDTTAETLVGAGDDVQSLLVLEGLGLSVGEDGLGGLTISTGDGHRSLGLVETGRSDNLHGVGDLLDVFDGLEAALDFTQSREAGGIGRRSTVKNTS